MTANVKEQIQKLAEYVTENERKIFSVSELAKKFAILEDDSRYRYDIAFRNIAQVIHKKAFDNSFQTITANEIQNLHNKFFGLYPQSSFKEDFKEFFPAEIKKEAQVNSAIAMRDNFTSNTIREMIPEKKETIEVDEYEDIQQKIEMPEAFKPFEEVLEDAIYHKESKYDNDTIRRGIELVKSEFSRLGFNPTKVRLGKDNESSMNFKATINTNKEQLDVEVPIEVYSKQVLFPTIFKFAGKEYKFSEKGFNEVLSSKVEEIRPVKYNANMVSMSYNDLRKSLHESTIARDFVKANECLNLIGEKFGSDFLKNAVEDYQNDLKEVSQDYSQRCGGCLHYKSRIVKGSTHANDFCQLLSLPCNKVIKKGSICTRSTIGWDQTRDSEYCQIMNTSKIVLT